jgi:hypothetical protein
MDYLKNHKEITDLEFEKIKSFIIDKLIIEYDNGTNVLTVFDNVKRLLKKQYLSKNLIYKYYSEIGHTHYTFNNHNIYYDKKRVDTIKSILSKDVYEEYSEIIESNTNNNYFPEIIRNLKYEDFYPELLRYDVHIKCDSILYGSSARLMELLKLFYEKNDYSEFKSTMLSVEIDTQSIKKIFIKYNRKLGLINNIIKTEVDDSKLKENEKNLDINELTTNDKSFLFYFMCKVVNDNTIKNKNPFNLPFTELLRLNTIIDFKDNNAFKDNYRDSNHYKILSNGISFFPPNERLPFLTQLISNIKDLKLKDTTKYLQEFITKIKNEAITKKK